MFSWSTVGEADSCPQQELSSCGISFFTGTRETGNLIGLSPGEKTSKLRIQNKRRNDEHAFAEGGAGLGTGSFVKGRLTTGGTALQGAGLGFFPPSPVMNWFKGTGLVSFQYLLLKKNQRILCKRTLVILAKRN
jgi:hypothetical protein